MPVKLISFLLAAAAMAQPPSRFTPGIKPFVAFDDPVIALMHARVIDGTGAAPREDQTVIIHDGKIAAIGMSKAPDGARVIDLTGHTVMPGMVGMHEHLYYPVGGGVPMYPEMAYSFPRLYLAAGVTTARTAGSVEPFTDMNVKAAIDAGKMPGPRLYITGPYLEGKPAIGPQMHELTGPEDATRFVEYWAAQGATSFKAYMNITRGRN
jgi:imidazolonepropionase-like amidohydrolase